MLYWANNFITVTFWFHDNVVFLIDPNENETQNLQDKKVEWM